MGPSALAAKLNKPLGSAASLDGDLEEEHFCAEPVDAVATTEDEVRAPAQADDAEAAAVDATAHSVQADIDARGETKALPETTVLLVGDLHRSTVKTPIHMSPPRFCPPSSRVFEPDKLTNCDKSGPCLVLLEACRLDILASKKRSECGISCYHGIVF
jgi:hypothetical protein